MGILNTVNFIINHPLNKKHPFSTIYRFLKWQIHSRFKNEIIFDWIDGSKMAVSKGMAGATGNIYCGLHEYRDMSFLLHILGPSDVFVDVGANVGSYTVLASAVCGAKTVAIEPDQQTARRLARNVEINNIYELVDTRITAVGAECGQIGFTVGQDTINRVASREATNIQIVPIARLDDLLDGINPNLIKIDVEGFETQVLLGSERTLKKTSLHAILLETVDDDSHNLLNNSGFELVDYNPISRQFSKNYSTNSQNSLYIRNREKLEDIISQSKTRIFNYSVI
jgi:FkbM family methyltransferase